MLAHNLPAQPTPLVGRTEELTQIGSLLNDTKCPLLTLLGPGGIGKTRLALEAASYYRDYWDGAYFIPLQSLTSSEAIVPAIANGMNLELLSSSEPKQQLLNYLRNRHVLLVLDNFE